MLFICFQILRFISCKVHAAASFSTRTSSEGFFPIRSANFHKTYRNSLVCDCKPLASVVDFGQEVPKVQGGQKVTGNTRTFAEVSHQEHD